MTPDDLLNLAARVDADALDAELESLLGEAPTETRRRADGWTRRPAAPSA